MPPTSPPLSLYIHIPWCVRKCPYCDFNSHAQNGALPVDEYIAALLADLDRDLSEHAEAVAERAIRSVFFGGGTPSLFMPDAIARILDGVAARIALPNEAEVTLETNPGTVEHGRFDVYRTAGVDRLSFGVQSFDDDKLRRLGRIHSAGEAEAAIKSAQDAGFDNVNLDLMYALPEQTLAGALADVERALALQPTHVSHYQLTLEPNTLFAAKPPPLPDEDHAWDMQEACQARLAEAGYAQYEVSAYARVGTLRPSTRTSPTSGISCPVMWRSRVVLPVPLGPMIATMRPRGMSRSTRSKIVLPFSTVPRPRISTMLSACGGDGAWLTRLVRNLGGIRADGAARYLSRCGRRVATHGARLQDFSRSWSSTAWRSSCAERRRRWQATIERRSASAVAKSSLTTM